MAIFLIPWMSCLAQAQTARPLPGSMTVVGPEDEATVRASAEAASEEEEEDDAPKAFLRIWNAAGNEGGQIGIGLQPAQAQQLEDGDFLWLFRGVRTFDFRDYQEIPPGRYSLVVVQEIPVDHEDLENYFQRPSKDKLLHRSPSFELRENQSLTLLLEREGERWTHRELVEPLASGKHLRVLSMVDAPVEVGIEARDGRVATLWGGNQGTPEIISLPEAAKEAVVLVRFPNQRGTLLSRRHETDFGSAPSISVVVFPDRYGRITSRVFSNSPEL